MRISKRVILLVLFMLTLTACGAGDPQDYVEEEPYYPPISESCSRVAFALWECETDYAVCYLTGTYVGAPISCVAKP